MKISNSFFVLFFETVEVADDATRFWSILFDHRCAVGEITELCTALVDVEDVAVDVEIVETEWISFSDLFKQFFCLTQLT